MNTPGPDAQTLARWKAAEEASLARDRAERERRTPSILWIVAAVYGVLLVIQLTCDWPL